MKARRERELENDANDGYIPSAEQMAASATDVVPRRNMLLSLGKCSVCLHDASIKAYFQHYHAAYHVISLRCLEVQP
jgi:hypothetical protein